jgi:uncharacterized protein YidB (DUF937 family)
MSPITMAILGLLAYKALKSFTSQPANAGPAPGTPAPAPGASPGGGLGDILKNVLGGSAPTQAGSPGAGGLNDILKGGLGGLLAGGAAGTVLSGGLNDVLKQLQQAGQGDVAKSWVGTGPNKAISPDDLASALGADQVNALSAHSGLSQNDLLSQPVFAPGGRSPDAEWADADGPGIVALALGVICDRALRPSYVPASERRGGRRGFRPDPRLDFQKSGDGCLRVSRGALQARRGLF